MRNPKVENKYGLTISKAKKLKIGNRDEIKAPLFWRNNAISAWCISGVTGTKRDMQFATNDEFWIGIYDIDAPSYAGEFRFTFNSYGGMCGYEFENFFDESEIENENDLSIQEKFISIINELIDKQILLISEVC